MSLDDRLYLADPLALEFTSTVTAHASVGEQSGVVLEKSAFYPESGGQLGDHGVLVAGSARHDVVDVQLVEGRVVHLIAGELPPVGVQATGAVERARRRSHMSLHSGQHLLSRALELVCEADTVSARLGERTCTIDLDKKITMKSARAAAERVNAIVDEDRPIVAHYPDADTLAAMPLRRQPKVTQDIRIIEIADFDWTPCGGTHCTSSAQVGLVHVTQLEGYKGKTRVHFASGPRARARLFERAALVDELAAKFTAGAEDVLANISKLQGSLKDVRQQLGRAQATLLEGELAKIEAELAADGTFVRVLDIDKAGAQKAVSRLATGARRLVVGAREADAMHVIVARGPDASGDAGAKMKSLALENGGRGGGKETRAEGRFPLFDSRTRRRISGSEIDF